MKSTRNENNMPTQYVVDLEPEFAGYFSGYQGAFGYDATVLQQFANGQLKPEENNTLGKLLHNTRATIQQMPDKYGIRIIFSAKEQAETLLNTPELEHHDKKISTVQPTAAVIELDPGYADFFTGMQGFGFGYNAKILQQFANGQINPGEHNTLGSFLYNTHADIEQMKDEGVKIFFPSQKDAEKLFEFTNKNAGLARDKFSFFTAAPSVASAESVVSQDQDKRDEQQTKPIQQKTTGM